MENENIQDLAGLQVQVTVMASYGITSLSKKLAHNCFSRLRSINEYLVIDWGGHDRWLGPNVMQQTVRVGLGVQSQSCAIVPLDDSGQDPGGL